MGRGLSDLQQFILQKTAKHGVLFREEIKEQFFHWRTPERPAYLRWPASLRPTPSRKFLEAERKDNSVSASIARTLTRLERRRLVNSHQRAKKREWHWNRTDAIVLTEEGRNYVMERLRLKPKKLRKAKDGAGNWTVLQPIG